MKSGYLEVKYYLDKNLHHLSAFSVEALGTYDDLGFQQLLSSPYPGKIKFKSQFLKF
jgi:hypothetical protein